MAAQTSNFSKFSLFCKRFSSSFKQFIPLKPLKYNQLHSKVNFQQFRALYSCKFPQNRPVLKGWEKLSKYGFVDFQSNCCFNTSMRFYSRGRKTSKDTKGAKTLEESNTVDDTDDELENLEILEELREKTGLEQGHNVLVIQPDFKWGKNRFHLETVDHMLGEALSLVESINGWSVVEGRTEPIRKPDARYFFGKGKLEELTKIVKKLKVSGSLSAVFLDVGRLTRRQHLELEELWGLKVFDRFSLVVQIFKERAVTSEAKVQVELAELGYIRCVDFKNDYSNVKSSSVLSMDI